MHHCWERWDQSADVHYMDDRGPGKVKHARGNTEAGHGRCGGIGKEAADMQGQHEKCELIDRWAHGRYGDMS
jgi:hypothetical protein